MEDKTAIGISDIPLLEYTNFFIANEVWADLGVDKDIATYDLVIRELPDKWNFFVFDGLDRLIQYISNFQFDEESILILKELGMIKSKKSEDFYRNFRFSGDLCSLKNGTIFFPGEPIVRITAPMKEANLLTAFLMNILNYPIRILTKAVRIKTSAKDTPVSMISVCRLPSFEASYFQMRAGLVVGCSPGAVPLTYKKFKELEPDPQKVFFNINHAVIKSFPTERLAFNYIFNHLAGKYQGIWVMIDTYDTEKGIFTFIDEVKKVPNIDKKCLYVGLDSGDLAKVARYVRKLLDKNDLKDIRIQAMSNLEEYKIDKMVRDGVPIDFFTVVTEFVNVTDSPKLEVVYKLAELVHPDGSMELKAKLTKGKESYPGRKQVYRVQDKGKNVKDVVGFEDEELGEPLLQKVISNGKVLIREQGIDEVKSYLEKQLEQMPDVYLNVNRHKRYPVELSPKLKIETENIRKKHS